MNNRSLRNLRPIPRAAGFTLMEMIAVIVLLGIVITIVGGGMMNTFKGGKYKAGTIQAKKLAGSVEQYQMAVGSYPNSLEDLTKREGLGPYAKDTDLKDPFGHQFMYKKPGDAGREFDVIFLGADGKPGGDSTDKDYGSWE